MDSNHRRQSQQIYSLPPLATWVTYQPLQGDTVSHLGTGLSMRCCGEFKENLPGWAGTVSLKPWRVLRAV